MGSFLNVVADRLPEGRSFVTPRSHCSACNKTLSNIELVPVFSYLWLRGRCRHCGVGIPARLTMVEVVTGLLFMAVYFRVGVSPAFVVLTAATALLVVVAVIDLEIGLIPNRIVFPGIVILLMLSPWWPQLGVDRTFLGDSTALASLSNSLVAGVGSLLFFLAIALAYPNGMGGGDVKLAGLIGLLVGYPGVVVALYGAVVVGGVVAISLLLVRRKGRKDSMPFGPFLSLGGIAVLLAGNDIIPAFEYVLDRFAGL